MRIVTWNCNGALRKKFRCLEDLDAEIIVVQECEDPARIDDIHFKEWAGNYLWKGSSKDRGVGVFTSKYQVPKITERCDDVDTVIACQCGLTPVLAIWAKKSRRNSMHYVGQVWQLLERYENLLEDPRVLLVGDFNSNAKWDKPSRIWNHSALADRLAKKGIRSLYHEDRIEAHGEESQPTFMMHRNKNRPYHIDYVFAGSAWKKNRFEIGTPNFWLEFSDHLPLIADLEVL